ncbi:ATP-grasp domain-containing protein [Pseudoalteromonas sp. T1lg88]|uniref:ATP-grasp domain-containing protein n=1 Tax=Pseudoalteromonas sp. T1lg88 TaxID=2077104 RepID=UPI000CF67E4C|nr:ATP-grasp domain-containing protein [Pseudoalteromonas sp. T1lg88]
MMKVLVVPCGTEIAHEIVRSLYGVKGVEVFGANSVNCYTEISNANVFLGIPFIHEADFIDSLNALIGKHGITHVFPAHDSAALKLTEYAKQLDAKVVSSSFETNDICRSKKKTYACLEDVVRVPTLFNHWDENLTFPLFAKPDVGQGSVGTKRIDSRADLEALNDNDLLCELLPGSEYTVDCVSDAGGELLYAGPRRRCSMRNGIAVETELVTNDDRFYDIALKISQRLELRGAWFFQVKEDENGELCLLEVATRIAGSMITNRFNGINFTELSLLVAEGVSVKALPNKQKVKLYRNLSYQFHSDLNFTHLYTDFDDCLIVNDKVNTSLLKLIYECINKGGKVSLITRHERDIEQTLREYRLSGIFDEVIHIQDKSPKSDYIDASGAIFIDDAFSERADVRSKLGIPTFSVDMVECLLNAKS